MRNEFNGRRADSARERELQRQWAAGVRADHLIVEMAAYGLLSVEEAKAALLLHHPVWGPRIRS